MLTQREYEALDERARKFVYEFGLREEDIDRRLLAAVAYREKNGTYNLYQEVRHYLEQRVEYLKKELVQGR